MNIKLLLIILMFLSNKSNIKNIQTIEKKYSHKYLSSSQILDKIWDDSFIKGYGKMEEDMLARVESTPFSDYDFLMTYPKPPEVEVDFYVKTHYLRQNGNYFESITVRNNIELGTAQSIDKSDIEKYQMGYDKT